MMSGLLKGKLFAQSWESANLFIRSAAWHHSLASRPSTCPKLARNTFSQNVAHSAFEFVRTTPRNEVRRTFASGSIPLLGLNQTTVATNFTLCTNAAENALALPKKSGRRKLISLGPYMRCRRIHLGSRKGGKSGAGKDWNLSKQIRHNRNSAKDTRQAARFKSDVRNSENDSVGKPTGLADTTGTNSYFHLPKMPHRPTKEELLAAATGFWSRLRVRFKWFSIRSLRPWNVDDWSAFASWLLVGHIVWILIGTTTFFSILIFTINTVAAQETLARWIGDYLTNSAGIKVVFESAIVPKWKDGVITFQNVFVSRRPGQGKSRVRKGSSITAAAAAAAEREKGEAEQEDTNYTQFDVTIDTINVTLSFVKWWNGRGILRDVEVKGVRGVVDRTHVQKSEEYVDPRTYRREHNPGDFEADSFRLEDLLLSVHQPKGFRPYSVSVFTCELPQLRKQWLFYDFLSATQMSGSFDGSLFTIHPHQSHSTNGNHNQEGEAYADPNIWKKHSRLRIDGMKIDHLNRGISGPFGWIHEGNVDIVADILLPPANHESIGKVMSDIYDRMEATVTSNRYIQILEQNPSNADLNTPEQRTAIAAQKPREDDKRFLIMDVKVSLHNVRAAVPLFTNDLSYINQALIRPIVAYINSKQAFIPINCRIVKRENEFDGSWTIFDSGLMDDLSAETYSAFAKDVTDRQARVRRLKKVGFWSISLAIQALFMGLAGSVA